MFPKTVGFFDFKEHLISHRARAAAGLLVLLEISRREGSSPATRRWLTVVLAAIVLDRLRDRPRAQQHPRVRLMSVDIDALHRRLRHRQVRGVFYIASVVTYVVCDLALVTYHPQLGQWALLVEAPKEGPAMYWYGWTAHRRHHRGLAGDLAAAALSLAHARTAGRACERRAGVARAGRDDRADRLHSARLFPALRHTR